MLKKIALSIYITVFMGVLTACSPTGLLNLEKTKTHQQNTTETSGKLAGNTTSNSKIGTPVALPPAYDQKPLKPGQTRQDYMPNGLPALKPMKGVNVDTLFSEKIRDNGKRFNRVENAVVDLRKEFELYKPSIVRLSAVESDIQHLIKELEVLLQETPPEQNNMPVELAKQNAQEAELQVKQLDPNPIQANPKQPSVPSINPKPPPKKKATSKTIPPDKNGNHIYSDGVIAQNLRVGEHADKVRLVLDTNKKTKYSIDLDNDENLIIIELPEAKWTGQYERDITSSALIESYVVEPLNQGKGSMIIISLTKKTGIMRQERLSPDGSSAYHRIYFDLKP
ncbi:MAG: hypothetical protein ACRBDL_02235 [Alphaproteobacteria bacterium]